MNKAKQERLHLEKKSEEASHFYFISSLSRFSLRSFFNYTNCVNHVLVDIFVFFHLGTYTKRKEGTRRKGAKTEENDCGGKNSELATDET